MKNEKLQLKIKNILYTLILLRVTRGRGSHFAPQRILGASTKWECLSGRTRKLKSLGFTLVELLVVVALVGIIGAITTQVFIIGFKSQGKSEIVKEVKQNGDYAMSVIETMVRNAADFSADSACNQNAKTLSIVNPDGYTTIFDCSADQIASISALPTTTPGVNPTGVLLTSSKVSIPSANCNFRIICPTPPLNPKYVFVDFTVTQGVVTGQPTPLPENTASLEYSGTFSLGKYK